MNPIRIVYTVYANGILSEYHYPEQTFRAFLDLDALRGTGIQSHEALSRLVSMAGTGEPTPQVIYVNALFDKTTVRSMARIMGVPSLPPQVVKRKHLDNACIDLRTPVNKPYYRQGRKNRW